MFLNQPSDVLLLVNHYPSASWIYSLSPGLSAMVALSFVLLLIAPGAIAQNTVDSDNNSASRGRVGDTELHWAAFRGHASVVERLLVRGAQVNQRVDKGSTPLHLAAYKGHQPVVSLLIEYGADVNARNEEGITPLDWARSNNHSETEALLLANGAVVGKPLPVKPQPKRSGVTPSAGVNLERPLHKSQPKAGVEDDFVERPIQQDELDRLESVSQINRMMEKYRNEQAGRGVQEVKPPEKALPIQAYRVQLVAVSDYDRAEALRAEYAKRYSDILGEGTLVVEPVNTAERTLYRLRSSALSDSKAAFVCEQLKRNNQDCFIVAPSGL